MKRAVLAVLAVLALAGTVACGGYNSLGCRQSVMDEFQTADVYPLPRSNYSFLARDKEGNVWYVECMNNTDTKVTNKFIIVKK